MEMLGAHQNSIKIRSLMGTNLGSQYLQDKNANHYSYCPRCLKDLQKMQTFVKVDSSHVHQLPPLSIPPTLGTLIQPGTALRWYCVYIVRLHMSFPLLAVFIGGFNNKASRTPSAGKEGQSLSLPWPRGSWEAALTLASTTPPLTPQVCIPYPTKCCLTHIFLPGCPNREVAA